MHLGKVSASFKHGITIDSSKSELSVEAGTRGLGTHRIYHAPRADDSRY